MVRCEVDSDKDISSGRPINLVSNAHVNERHRPNETSKNDEDAKFFALTQAALNFDPENHSDATLRVGDDANVIHAHYNTTDWVTELKGRVRFDPLKTISSAHHLVRTSHMTDEFAAAIRMTEELTETWLADVEEEQKINPFANPRTEFEIEAVVERAFNMSMLTPRQGEVLLKLYAIYTLN